MDRISNADQLVIAFRQRLLEKLGPRGRAAASKTTSPAPSSARAIQAMAEDDGVDDRQLGRALIQNLLAEQFGQHMINDARFQQVVDQVNGAMAGDEQGARLLARLVAELRAAAA